MSRFRFVGATNNGWSMMISRYCPNCDKRLPGPQYDKELKDIFTTCSHCNMSWHIKYWNTLPVYPIGAVERDRMFDIAYGKGHDG